jgi:hypothetical protein
MEVGGSGGSRKAGCAGIGGGGPWGVGDHSRTSMGITVCSHFGLRVDKGLVLMGHSGAPSCCGHFIGPSPPSTKPLSPPLTPPISHSPSVSICTHSCTFIGIRIGSHASVGARICSRSILGGMGVVWGGLEAIRMWGTRGGGPTAMSHIPEVEGAKVLVGAGPGEAAPAAHPMGPLEVLRAVFWVALDTLMALLKVGGGPTAMYSISEVWGEEIGTGGMAPGACPTGSLGVRGTIVPVTFDGLVALVTGGGGPTIVCCIPEVKGAGGGMAPRAGIASNGTGAVGVFWVRLDTLGL